MRLIFTLLVLAVVFVNGWTDAPNAIASCVGSRSMKVKSAVIMAGIFNLAGALLAAFVSSGVAKTMYSIVDFGENDALALRSLCAAMAAVVLWAIIAFLFGIPTSESHALIAGLVGAALGGRMSAGTVDFRYFGVILLGLAVSTLPAYMIARASCSFFVKRCQAFDRRRVMRHFVRAQRVGAAGSAFMHGAQDSQKFAGVLMLGWSLSGADLKSNTAFLCAVCAVVISAGTLLGGGRIIKRVGGDMVRLDACSGASADAASSIVLLACTLLGIPVSTTHSKTCAIMGAGSLGRGGVDREVVKQMILAWVLTFPCCFFLGFFFSLLIK